MPSSLFTRALAAFLAAALTAASGASAQMDSSSSLAPQDGLFYIPSPLDPQSEQRRFGPLAPISPGSMTKTVLSLSALFFENSAPIESGLHWRIFADQPDLNGNHALVEETTESKPFVTLDPGGYIVHVSYGLASATRHVILGTESVSEEVTLNAGALRFSGAVANRPIPAGDLTFEIHRPDGENEELVGTVKAGEILRLKSGDYQITSTYGQTNARVISEIRVEPGKLIEASVLHKAGKVDLRLVGANGAEVADATWSILTPGGDVVAETLPTLKDVVLAEGEYIAVARHNGRTFQKPFEVQTGRAAAVDLNAD